MYVSKELALILKENGFNYHKFDLIIAPTEQEAVDWIFDNLTACDINDALLDYDINQLKFWYTTLLEHKFRLMHEFIGRLEEWFESNGLFLDIKPTRVTVESGYITQYRVVIFDYRKNKSKLLYYDECNWHTFEDGDSDILETKRQAKHEAIMKCFELLKTDKHEE